MFISVDDIKQYLYCNRIPVYNHIFNNDITKPFLVNYGAKFEKGVDIDFIRKTISKNEHHRFKISKVKIISNKLHLIGIPDLLCESKDKIIPVEIKYSKRIQYNTIYQLWAYAILIEEEYGLEINVGYILYGKDSDIKFRRVKIYKKDKINTLKIINELIELINRVERPKPTENINKCYYCEYKDFCDDVL